MNIIHLIKTVLLCFVAVFLLLWAAASRDSAQVSSAPPPAPPHSWSLFSSSCIASFGLPFLCSPPPSPPYFRSLRQGEEEVKLENRGVNEFQINGQISFLCLLRAWPLTPPQAPPPHFTDGRWLPWLQSFEGEESTGGWSSTPFG